MQTFPIAGFLMTFLFYRDWPHLSVEVVEQEEWAGRFRSRLPVTVPVRFVWSQREMNCINGECVLHQVQVRLQSQLNRTGPVQFISTVKTDRQRDLQGTAGAATSSVCFLQNIRCMNQTSYLQNNSSTCAAIPFPLLLQAFSGSTSTSPPSSWTPSLPLLLQPERGKLFEGLWLPGWFSIKRPWFKEPSDFLTKKRKKSYKITVKKQLWFR